LVKYIVKDLGIVMIDSCTGLCWTSRWRKYKYPSMVFL